MVSFRGQKKLEPRPDRSPLGFNSKFPTSIPTPFICRVPPTGGLEEMRTIRSETNPTFFSADFRLKIFLYYSLIVLG